MDILLPMKVSMASNIKAPVSDDMIVQSLQWSHRRAYAIVRVAEKTIISDHFWDKYLHLKLLMPIISAHDLPRYMVSYTDKGIGDAVTWHVE